MTRTRELAASGSCVAATLAERQPACVRRPSKRGSPLCSAGLGRERLLALVYLLALGCTSEAPAALECTRCDGVCVDLSTHPGHCGSCSNRCSAVQICVAGACALNCATPDGALVDRRFPVKVKGLKDVVAIAVADTAACAVTKAGAAYCWGENRGARLGKLAKDGANAEPVQLAFE